MEQFYRQSGVGSLLELGTGVYEIGFGPLFGFSVADGTVRLLGGDLRVNDTDSRFLDARFEGHGTLRGTIDFQGGQFHLTGNLSLGQGARFNFRNGSRGYLHGFTFLGAANQIHVYAGAIVSLQGGSMPQWVNDGGEVIP
ncbi:MAG: hypothetical protein L0Y72_07645 [Gemmataceae bacterium]|nr:hypothetical protein [Gemmataceae bacterium]MCI0738902.1 hypothetical protein [Gemmataceae bacterium]